MDMTNPNIKYYKSGKIESKGYFLDDRFHNESGPAYVEYYESGQVSFEQFCIGGKQHNDSGPALITYYQSEEIHSEDYYLDGKHLGDDLKIYTKEAVQNYLLLR